ncbi:MAG TPA: HIRAN domain-containing protein [Polyangium sp.]|nr:HIRAN domain-containing protein [Polyangium sp.]
MSDTILYLAWQDPSSRRWFTVGRLRKLETHQYEFVYIEGYNSARKLANMEPLVGFIEPEIRYLSETLFPFFQNRIMSPNREDFGAYIQKLGFDAAPKEPLDILARSEGHRATDSFHVFPEPKMRNVDGRPVCTFEFFIHGIRHVRPEVQNLTLQTGTQLFLQWDFQNTYDTNALTLRTNDNYLLGWVPRFYCADILTLREYGQKINVIVSRMNTAPVPSWFRIMCRLEAQCPNDFRPFASPEFQPLKRSPAR